MENGCLILTLILPIILCNVKVAEVPGADVKLLKTRTNNFRVILASNFAQLSSSQNFSLPSMNGLKVPSAKTTL